MKKKEKKLINFLQLELEKTLELENGVLFCYSKETKIDDLSKILKINSSQIISFFWKIKKNITKNQILNFDLVKEFCENKKIRVVLKKQIEINQIITKYFSEVNDEKKLTRTPIVSVMGHIDHGKSTLLDTIRGKKDQKNEIGGITQTINFYSVNFKGKKITFLDTPGHNVFLKMRERGASFTDLVILIIASEDGVMPQTLEVIDHIHKYKIPTIVFINNKREEFTNKNNLDKIKNQLQQKGLVSSEWGGDVTIISGSAINKKDTDELLDNVLMISEIYDWKASFLCTASGTILDNYTTNQNGIVSTVLIKNGSLKNKEILFINGNSGKVREIVDFSGNKLPKAEPGDVVKIFGLGFETEPGDNFIVINDDNLVKKIKRIIPNKGDSRRFSQEIRLNKQNNSKRKNVNLILVSDSQSSLEALENIAKTSSTDEMFFNMIYSEVGDLTESTINIAKITQSSILLFNIKVNQNKAKELKENNIKWYENSIIYKFGEAIIEIKRSLKDKKMVEKIIGVAEIKKIFYFSQVGSIAGCQVLNGVINRNHLVNVFRRENKIFSGKIGSLQKDKTNIKEINKGQECGIVINGFNDFEINDRIISYSLVDEETNV